MIYQPGADSVKAVEALKIPVIEPFHAAISDARYTAKVLAAAKLGNIKDKFTVDVYQRPKKPEDVINERHANVIDYISVEYPSRAVAMADEDVAAQAKAQGVTRAHISVDKAALLDKPVVYAVGNAPTALIRLCDYIKEGTFLPAAVIGVPVGFVNVVQSKEMLIASGIPCIAARGRKGGSTVAAAICNALLYMSDGTAHKTDNFVKN